MDTVETLIRQGEATLTLGEIVGKIEGDDGPGPVLFLLTLPVLLPLPPGVSMVMALPLLIVAPQVMAGRPKLWIPHWLSRRAIKRTDLVKTLQRLAPALKRAEAAVHPRLRMLTGRTGEALAGAMCSLLALVLVLPIPFANLLPSLAICVFAIGLTRKDGGFILGGYALVVLAVAAIVFGAHGAALGVAAVRRMI